MKKDRKEADQKNRERKEAMRFIFPNSITPEQNYTLKQTGKEADIALKYLTKLNIGQTKLFEFENLKNGKKYQILIMRII